jgi:hypothetical protein
MVLTCADVRIFGSLVQGALLGGSTNTSTVPAIVASQLTDAMSSSAAKKLEMGVAKWPSYLARER